MANYAHVAIIFAHNERVSEWEGDMNSHISSRGDDDGDGFSGRYLNLGNLTVIATEIYHP